MRRVAVVALLAVLVAALSLLLQAVPGFDAQGWLLWGRELTSGGPGALNTLAYPSWKPLSALLTTPLALAGGAAPALLLVVIRASALLAAAVAFRLAARFAGPVAGAAAALGVLLLDHFTQYAARGAIEPLLALVVLGAADRHLAGRHGQAAALLALAALGRPEAFALYALYGLLLVRRRPVLAVPLAAGAAAIAGLWLGGDYAGSGDPFHGAVLARRAHETVVAQRTGDPVGAAIRAAASVVLLPLLAGATVGMASAWRRREAGLLLIGAAALAWVAVDAVMAARGYPAIGRFLIPAGALACVPGGVGLRRLAGLARGSAPRRVAVAAALAALVIPVLLTMPGQLARQARADAAWARAASGLDGAVARAGGPERIRAAGWSTTEHAFQTHLAWQLGVSSSAVRRRAHGPGLAFSPGPRPYEALGRTARQAGLRRLGNVDGWTVWRIPRGGRA